MPSLKTYNHWKATQAPFCEAVFMLRRRRNEKLGEIGRARRRAFDPVVADRVIVALHKAIRAGLTLDQALAADPELPCRPTLRRWRREEPEFGRVLAMMFALRPLPEAPVEEVVDHIVEGGSFASYSRLPGGPSRTTLRRWFHGDTAFAREVTEACAWREERYADHVLMAAQDAGDVVDATRRVEGLKRQLGRLRHRPGAEHAAQPLTQKPRSN